MVLGEVTEIVLSMIKTAGTFSMIYKVISLFSRLQSLIADLTGVEQMNMYFKQSLLGFVYSKVPPTLQKKQTNNNNNNNPPKKNIENITEDLIFAK